jgi:hypothetical protein
VTSKTEARRLVGARGFSFYIERFSTQIVCRGLLVDLLSRLC